MAADNFPNPVDSVTEISEGCPRCIHQLRLCRAAQCHEGKIKLLLGEKSASYRSASISVQLHSPSLHRPREWALDNIKAGLGLGRCRSEVAAHWACTEPHSCTGIIGTDTRSQTRTAAKSKLLRLGRAMLSLAEQLSVICDAEIVATARRRQGQVRPCRARCRQSRALFSPQPG